MMRYNDDYAVELFDRVDVYDGEFWCEGQVTAIHQRLRQVSVRYDTGNDFRTTGNPRLRTDKFDLANVSFSGRDG